VFVVGGADLAGVPEWQQAFARQRKDRRYYDIVEGTIRQGFDYRYFVIEDAAGRVRAVQPFFLLQQDLLQGAGPRTMKWVGRVRRVLPKFLTMRTLMVGCAAGEGHLDETSDEEGKWVAGRLHEALKPYAQQIRARMVVLKEFPSAYREALTHFATNGYARVPSLPMTRLNIAYESFEDYLAKALSKVSRKSLRRKFKKLEGADAITMEVLTDITPVVDEIHPLYLQVYDRSNLHFEKLTKEYLCRLGREMPDKARFFVWRQKGKAIAVSICLVHDQTIYDEYLGLDYSVALDLHLYFVTIRDILQWGMERGYKWYCSSALNYDPKLHLKCELVPLDLYVMHTWPVANFVLKRVLPLLEPTRQDPTLRQFPNYHELWGNR
jgi:predicted N-acyltransferase